MRVLVSAYACTPGRGSEPGAGWEWAAAAARENWVMLLTRSNNRAEIEAALAGRDDLALQPVYLDYPNWVLRIKKRTGVHLYYLMWQALALVEARRLNRTMQFDVVHHLTFASDWLPVGAAFGAPSAALVWGPIGGYAPVRTSLWRWLGSRGIRLELVRLPVSWLLRMTMGRFMARRSSLVVAMNHDVARVMSRWVQPDRLVVEPNVAVAPDSPAATARAEGVPKRALFVANLHAWKGALLAVDTLAEPAAAGWSLAVYGDGPARAEMEQRAASRGVADRIVFHGHRPRTEIGEALRSAGALLFPSMHDSAGWAVAEAVAAGCPVVCLDVGGPPVVIEGGGGIAVKPSRRAPRDLAAALNSCAATGDRARWGPDRLPGLLSQWYRRAVSD